MAYTQSDLDNLDKAIAKGYLTVRHSDGKQITYRTVDEMVKARDLIKKELAKSDGKRRRRAFVARTTKGL